MFGHGGDWIHGGLRPALFWRGTLSPCTPWSFMEHDGVECIQDRAAFDDDLGDRRVVRVHQNPGQDS